MQIFGIIKTLLPSKGTESTQTEARMTPYGELLVAGVLDEAEGSAMEGSTYVARATPVVGGTGVAMGIQTSFSDTANIAVCLQNNNGAGGKTIFPQYIKGRVTAAGSTTTVSEAAVEVDSTNRYSSGGTVLSGLPTNPSGAATGAVIHVGAVTAAAAGAGRAWVWSRMIRKAAAPAWIVNDEIYFIFGALGSGSQGYQKFANPMDTQADPGTAFIFPLPQPAIPPTATLLLHIANLNNATTPPSFEWEIGYIER